MHKTDFVRCWHRRLTPIAVLEVIALLGVLALSQTATGAMLHVTPDYASQQTTMTTVVGVPFDVYVYADDLTNGGLWGAEFGLTVPPNIFHLSSTVLHSGLNLGTFPEYIMGYPVPVWEPADLVRITLLDIAGLPDQLIAIGPITFPSLPGTPVVVDPLNPAILYPVDYSSGLLLNPSGAIPPPAWTPEPATVAILGLGSLALVGRRRRGA